MPDKNLIPLYIAGTLLLTLIAGFVIFLVVNFRNRLNRYYIEKQRLLSANVEEGERMLSQVAREIHDNIGQLSHMLHSMLCKIEKSIGPHQVHLVTSAKQISDQIITNADDIGESLNSSHIKSRGLANMLSDNLDHIGLLGNIVCSMDLVGTARLINPDKELVIYRIAQEAIHNSLKYAQASQLEILLCYGEEDFSMKIKDNGIGFDVALPKGKMGIANMNQRAKLLNGSLQIVSAPGHGCSITLLVPMPY